MTLQLSVGFESKACKTNEHASTHFSSTDSTNSCAVQIMQMGSAQINTGIPGLNFDHYCSYLLA